jgi:hypothetical protein
MSELNIETHIAVKESIFTFIKDTSVLSHTLLFGPFDINSLTIRKEATLDENRVLYVGKQNYDLTTDIFSWEELKHAYKNKFFAVIDIPSHNLHSPLLKIVNLHIDNDMIRHYSISLEEF